MTLTALDWLDTWERSQNLPLPLRPCALLAPLMPGGQAAAEQLPLGWRDRQLLQLHAALFGPALPATVACPACNERLEITLDCHALQIDAPSEAPRELSVQWQGERISYRLPDSRDLAALQHETDTQAAQSRLLQRCAPAAITLPDMAREEIAAAMAQADPQAATLLDLQCPNCAEQWDELFDIGVYLDDALAQWSERLLDQVHVLAQAYGWSETQILALSPNRRARYLARVLS